VFGSLMHEDQRGGKLNAPKDAGYAVHATAQRDYQTQNSKSEDRREQNPQPDRVRTRNGEAGQSKRSADDERRQNKKSWPFPTRNLVWTPEAHRSNHATGRASTEFGHAMTVDDESRIVKLPQGP
jgi:hypothetical protein